jgi:RNA polymerase sigma-70 factor (ECF subfamily)
MSFRSGSDDANERAVENAGLGRSKRKGLILMPAVDDLEGLSDEDLVTELKAGRHDALTTLFERHSSLVFGIARRILKDDGEAEEALQQVFLDTYRAIKQFDPAKASYKTWLLQFAYHRTIHRKHHLEAKRFYKAEEFKEELLPAYVTERVDRLLQLSSQEITYLVRQILSSIQPRQRKTIELTFFEGLTAEEIAAQTGETAAVVRHNLYRGLEKLRSALGEKVQADQKENVKEVKGVTLAQPRSL